MRNWKFLVPVALGINLIALILPSHRIRSGDSTSEIGILNQASQALNQVAQKVTPSVVSITSIKNRDLRKSALDLSIDPSEQALMGIGSGVIIRPDGVILTNEHVVHNAQKVTVTLGDKHKLSAHVIGTDPKTDLAVIQLDTHPSLPALGFGNSDQIKVGDWILAVGSPFGLTRSVTSGIVSAIGRAQLGMLDTEDFIQTDAAINPGNSGGPLINTNGEMIGLNTAIFSQSGGFVGIGFAIPSKIAKQVADEILEHGRVIRGWMGMTTQDIDEELGQYFHVKPNRGALVSDIQPNGPASQASLKEGDVVLSYNDVSIESARHLKSLVAKTRAQKEVRMTISRDGKTQTRLALVREQPAPKSVPLTDDENETRGQLAGQAAGKGNRDPGASLGLVVEDIPPEFSEMLEIPTSSGAIVTSIRPGSPAFEAGISRGDIILSADSVPVHSSKDFTKAIQKLKSNITVLYLQRGPDEKVFIPLKTG